MRYRIRVITLMAIAVAVFLFTIWMTSPQEVSHRKDHERSRRYGSCTGATAGAGESAR